MKYKVSLIIAFILFSSVAFADSFEREREIKKVFAVKEGTEIQLTNKYGNIEVINWEKDSVMFQVRISVVGNKLTRVNKTFAYLDVDFTANPYYIIAKTDIKNEKDNWWTDVSDITNSIFKGNNNTQINYTIFLPEYLPLKIRNKFGNIYLTNCNARTEIELSNGDLRANESNDFLHLNLSYGFANIKKIKEAVMEINYGELQSVSIDRLELNSRSSEIRCDNIKELQLLSKRDRINIGEIEEIFGKFSFSTINLDHLYHQVKLESNFGEITVDNIYQDFQKLYMNSNNTDISFSFERSSVYNIDLLVSRRTDVTLPYNCEIISQEPSEEDSDDTHIIATSGTKYGNTPNVKIEISSGSVRLSNK